MRRELTASPGNDDDDNDDNDKDDNDGAEQRAAANPSTFKNGTLLRGRLSLVNPRSSRSIPIPTAL